MRVGVLFYLQQKKQLLHLRKLPCDWEVGGHCIRKEMPVIPVKRVADKKRIIRKNGAK
jgi:hypothetical protein